MDNEIKNRQDSDDAAEFEIPDISAVSEELGISEERPEKSEPTPKKPRKKKKAEAEAEWATPTEEGGNAEHAAPKRRKRRPKAKIAEETATATGRDDTELAAAEDITSSTGETITESEVIPESEVSAEVEAVPESDITPENENITDSKTTSEDGAEGAAVAIAESEAAPEKGAAARDEAVSDSEAASEKGAALECEVAPVPEENEAVGADVEAIEAVRDTEAAGTSAADIPADEDNIIAEPDADISTGENSDSAEPEAGAEAASEEERAYSLDNIFADDTIVSRADEDEMDDDGAHVFVPREYRFPDDALSPSVPHNDDSLVIDLLGDPLIDEPYVAEEMRPTPISDAGIEPEGDEEEAPSTEEKYDPDKPRRIDIIFDFVELVIFTLVAVLFVTTFFVKHAVVDGNSMYDTLYPNDVLLISDLFYEPARGDIVVVEDYTLEREDMRKPLVKRVIATAGQLVKVTKDAIYVNAEKIDEPYVFTDTLDYEYSLIPSDAIASIPGFFANSEHYTFVVPEGEIFVMGDHRNNSTDSRDVGTIREDAVLGRALLRIYPFYRFGVIDD